MFEKFQAVPGVKLRSCALAGKRNAMNCHQGERRLL
jgi:hypothetical protein